jgi:hypothetical protein
MNESTVCTFCDGRDSSKETEMDTSSPLVQEVLSGWGQEQSGESGSSDPFQSLAVLKRIRKREVDHCWFCHKKSQKMTRSHVLLHCTNENLVAARQQAWGSFHPSSIRLLLASPRWESRLLHFLEFSGAGRVVENGEDEEESRAAKIDN